MAAASAARLPRRTGLPRRTARPTPDLLAIGVAVHLRFLSRAVELTL